MTDRWSAFRDEFRLDWGNGGPGHFVQFYREDEHLLRALCGYVGWALGTGSAVLLILTKDHKSHLHQWLEEGSIDPGRAEEQGRLLFADAEETVANVMDGDMPSHDRFERVFGGLLEMLASKNGSLAVFGEMAPLLCKKGNYEAGMQMEAFADEAVSGRPISVFCAYPLDCFPDASTTEMFYRTCEAHAHVVPAEPFGDPWCDRGEKLRAIAQLQHEGAIHEKESEERRRIEEKLQDQARSVRRLAAIVESSEDAIVAKNLDGIITSWNWGAQRMFGYTADEIIGQHVTLLFPADHLDEEMGILSQIKAGKRVEQYDTIRRRKDGSLVEVSLSVSPIKDESGRIV